MTRKAWTLIIAALVLGFLYAYHFTSWIHTPQIQILKSDRVFRTSRFPQRVYPVAFTLDGRYDVTSISVTPLWDTPTNRQPAPVWHVVPEKNPVPLKGFLYGQRLPGMQTVPPKQRPVGLEPGRRYHLTVRAGRARGDLEFRPTPVGPP